MGGRELPAVTASLLTPCLLSLELVEGGHRERWHWRGSGCFVLGALDADLFCLVKVVILLTPAAM